MVQPIETVREVEDGMKIGIMQPYFFPYIGYFQLMNAVDEFVVYDNIEYTKKGWINRNRILVNGRGTYISVPLKKDSDYLDIRERRLANSWPIERSKFANRITESYRQAPQFERAYPIVEQCLFFDDANLFNFLFNSLRRIHDYIGIKTPLIVSSTLPIDHALKAEQKVIAICKARQVDTYVNPIGGTALYDKEKFRNEGIALHFLKTEEVRYPQAADSFIPSLSIIDVMMYNSREEIFPLLALFQLV